MTTIVSIGFNYAGRDEAMPLDAQLAFSQSVLRAVKAAGGEPVFEGFGTGFDPTTGGSEESWTVVVIGDLDMDLLQRNLAFLAGIWGQESIAVTTGETTFVEAATATAVAV